VPPPPRTRSRLLGPPGAGEDLGKIDERVAAEVHAVGSPQELDGVAGERFGLVQAIDRGEHERSSSAAPRANLNVNRRWPGLDHLGQGERLVTSPAGVECAGELCLGKCGYVAVLRRPGHVEHLPKHPFRERIVGGKHGELRDEQTGEAYPMVEADLR
jgi:hypothetical protein